ncbi:MAG: hypothetical protein LUE92_13550 [Clostridiales bacterium]|nr:hypothetical protein [Clostridiales bacterium]
MKIIRITTNNEISTHEFPKGNHFTQNEAIRKLIGPKCDLYEHVMPNRLYKVLGGSNKASGVMGSCVSMLIDEEGLYHDLELNTVGSYLYETDMHGSVIVGNILIVGEVWTPDGIDFCGISEEQFNLLYPRLEILTKEARGQG